MCSIFNYIYLKQYFNSVEDNEIDHESPGDTENKGLDLKWMYSLLRKRKRTIEESTSVSKCENHASYINSCRFH